MALRSETPFRTAQEADALKQRGIFFENHAATDINEH
jgi:hypothetical protein